MQHNMTQIKDLILLSSLSDELISSNFKNSFLSNDDINTA